MDLASDLISQFAKITKDQNETKKESIVYGKAIVDNGVTYVQIDGSDRWTPTTTSATIKSEDRENGERVTVMIKDHTATIIGNTSTPSARADDVAAQGKKIDEFDIIVSCKVTTNDLNAINAYIETLKGISLKYEDMTAVTAEIETLQAKIADIEHVSATDVEAINGEFENIRALFGEFTEITTEDLDAVNAEIDNLQAYTANFTYVSAEVLSAIKANIESLNVKKLDTTWANIDFANIDMATIGQLFSTSGIIKDLTTDSGTVTGELVGVTIKGDYIEANTLRADKLVVLGENGIYYKLNIDGLNNISVSQASKFDVMTSEPENWSTNYKDYYVVNNNSYVHITGDSAPIWAENTYYKLNSAHESGLDGTAIIAKSITAEKVSVSDLVAFGATIGGFTIGLNSIYSGVKATIDNPNIGTYLDNEGQFAFGDSINYMRYFKVLDEEGNEILDESGNPTYKLEISADSIIFGNSGRTADELADLADHVKIGTYINPDTGEKKPSVELTEEDSTDKLLLTNETIVFTENSIEKTKVSKDSISTDNAIINNELQQDNFIWSVRGNGNYGLSWKGVTS